MRPRRFFLVDPTLRDASGHNLDYARIVLADTGAAGFDCHVFAHMAAVVGVAELGCPVVPWFSRGHKDLSMSGALSERLRRMIGPRASTFIRTVKRSLTERQESAFADSELARANAFALEVDDLLRSVAPAPGDRLFFPNVLWNEAVRLVQTIQAAGLDAVADIQVLFRFDPPTQVRAAQLLASVGQVKGVTWLADTDELAQDYSVLLQSTVRRARVPIEGDAIRKAAAIRRRPDPVVVLALGESRREKGFHLLPEIVERTIALDKEIEFRIQLSENVPGGEPGIVGAMSRLRDLKNLNVKLLPASIASTTFTTMLGEAHVLLLPYDPQSYRRRSSGLLVHGLAAGMFIVVSQEAVALKRCIDLNGSESQAIMCDRTIDGFSSAIVEAAKRARSADIPKLRRLTEEELPAPWADSV